MQLYQLVALVLGSAIGLAVPLQSDGGRGGGEEVSCGDKSISPSAHAPHWEYAGEFNTSAYCPCAKCCGKWAKYGRFADGTPVRVRNQRTSAMVPRIVAADPSLRFGAHLWIEGIGEAVVRDRGGSIKGARLDLFHETHEEALRFGRQTRKVWQVK